VLIIDHYIPTLERYLTRIHLQLFISSESSLDLKFRIQITLKNLRKSNYGKENEGPVGNPICIYNQ
jgi:hypothetical protein